ncbi:MAG: type II toxin-antitoxin system VapC family toxin [Nitrosomonadales bacterium]|nr:type II toxin-antitoxin system VapC family toxin [Nitrosomonadales bacterium]
MIVVDANILIYSLIESDYTPPVQKLREKDMDWRTTGLCLHEILNVLATYQRRDILKLAQCKKLLEHAERFIKVAQCEVKMDAALAVAAKYAITGYDAQYVALAQSLDAPLITEDRKLRDAVSGIAFSMQEYLAQ